MRVFSFVAVASTIMFTLAGCSDASGTTSGGEQLFDSGTSIPVPTPLVDAGTMDNEDAASATFTEVFAQIINGPPGCTECHPPSGALDLSTQATAYAALVSQPATSSTSCASQTIDLVTPGNADMSLLYLKVSNPPCGSKMPLGGTALDATQLQLISSWINGGALNN
jgi:hypothetical protein